MSRTAGPLVSLCRKRHLHALALALRVESANMFQSSDSGPLLLGFLFLSFLCLQDEQPGRGDRTGSEKGKAELSAVTEEGSFVLAARAYVLLV